LPKKAKPSKSTPGNALSKPTPTAVNPSLHGEAGTTDIAIPSTPARESAQPATRALLPSPNASDIPTADVTTVAKQSTRDPFVPFFSIRKDAAGDGSRTLSDYELSELKVTAILSDSRGGHFASIKTPSGKDFIVKPGSMIGARGGRIATILPSKLVIVEPAETATGSAGAIQRELSLKTPSASQGIVRAN
jgi:Tfp pilus assembly protein PilP